MEATTSQPPAEQAPARRFERRAPRLWFALLLLQVALVIALGASIGALDDALTQALKPLGARLSADALRRIVAGSMVSLCVLAPLSIAVTIRVLLRRYGWAELYADHVRLGYPFVPARFLTSKLPLQALSERRVTPHGVELKAPLAVLLRNSLYPLALPLIPLSGDEELAEAVAILDAEVQGARPAPFRFGREGRKDHVLLALGLVALLAVVAASLIPTPLSWRLGAGSPTALAFIVGTVTCFVSGGLVLRAFNWWIVRGVLLGGCLYLGQKAFLLRELSGAALGEQVLAVWTESNKGFALVKPDQEARLREELARHEVSLDEELPVWARRQPRALKGALAIAAFLLLCVGFAAVIELTPSAVFSRWWDPYGQGLGLAFSRDGRPLLLVLHGDLELALAAPGGLGLVERDEDWAKASARVDADARTWALDQSGGQLPPGVAFLWSGSPAPRALPAELPRLKDPVRLAREVALQDTLQRLLVILQGIAGRSKAGSLPSYELPESNVSTPARLAHFFPELPPGPLRDYVEGRTSTRCFHAQDEDGARLIAGVRQGRVQFCVLVPAGKDAQIYLRGIGFQTGSKLVSPVRLTQPGLRCVRVLPDATLRTRPEPPTLDQVLEAVRAVEAGASVDAATKGFLP